MTRKPTAERQEEILDAASRLLLRDGVAALTMATLAEAVGVTSGALFRHFPSRDAILLALAERMAARLRADLAAHVEGDAPTRLRAFIAARLGTVSRAPTAPAMVLSPDVHLALPPRAVRAFRVLRGLPSATASERELLELTDDLVIPAR